MLVERLWLWTYVLTAMTVVAVSIKNNITASQVRENIRLLSIVLAEPLSIEGAACLVFAFCFSSIGRRTAPSRPDNRYRHDSSSDSSLC